MKRVGVRDLVWVLLVAVAMLGVPIGAVAASETITISENTKTLDANAEWDLCTVSDGSSHELNLNTKTLTITKGNGNNDSGGIIVSSGTLTITNGEIKLGDNVTDGIKVKNTGSIVLGTNLTVSAPKGAAIWVTGGTLTINGAEVEGKEGSATAYVDGGSLVVKSGKLKSETLALHVVGNGTATLEDGEISSEGKISTRGTAIRAGWNGGNNKDGVITIKGGTVKTNSASECTAWANNGGTIIVQDTGTIEAGGNSALVATDYGTVEVKGGTVTATSAYAVLAHEGSTKSTATISGGTINGAVGAGSTKNGDNNTLTISGGKINGNVYQTKGTTKITGGVFKSDPSTYVDSNYTAYGITDSTNTYQYGVAATATKTVTVEPATATSTASAVTLTAKVTPAEVTVKGSDGTDETYSIAYTYQWKKTGADTVLGTESTYKTGSSVSDSGEYTCTVLYNNETVGTASATVTINAASSGGGGSAPSTDNSTENTTDDNNSSNTTDTTEPETEPEPLTVEEVLEETLNIGEGVEKIADSIEGVTTEQVEAVAEDAQQAVNDLLESNSVPVEELSVQEAEALVKNAVEIELDKLAEQESIESGAGEVKDATVPAAVDLPLSANEDAAINKLNDLAVQPKVVEPEVAELSTEQSEALDATVKNLSDEQKDELGIPDDFKAEELVKDETQLVTEGDKVIASQAETVSTLFSEIKSLLSSIPTAKSAGETNNGVLIATVLSDVRARRSGYYPLSVNLRNLAPRRRLRFWYSADDFRSAAAKGRASLAADSDSAFFLDETGTPTTVVSGDASKMMVVAYFEEETPYSPFITVDATSAEAASRNQIVTEVTAEENSGGNDNSTDTPTSRGSSSSGCDAGFDTLAVALLGLLGLRKK